jgi:hypothetical protein
VQSLQRPDPAKSGIASGPRLLYSADHSLVAAKCRVTVLVMTLLLTVIGTVVTLVKVSIVCEHWIT